MVFNIKKIRIIIFFSYLFLSLNNVLYAHMKGTYFTEKEAVKESIKLGCIGAHKNRSKWLPCKNEKELHKYLGK